jgi:hypothetical protein
LIVLAWAVAICLMLLALLAVLGAALMAEIKPSDRRSPACDAGRGRDGGGPSGADR